MNRQSLFASTAAPGVFAALGITVDAHPAVQTAGATWTQQSSAAGAPVGLKDMWAWDGANWTPQQLTADGEPATLTLKAALLFHRGLVGWVGRRANSSKGRMP